MLIEDFLVGSANIDNLDEKIKGTPILLKNKELKVNRVMSNSFGFGGTNACLIFEK
jgi:3-oxoacyl-(acyl-carrier-protein) synthase